jgi:hypothetical protein
VKLINILIKEIFFYYGNQPFAVMYRGVEIKTTFVFPNDIGRWGNDN